MVRRSAKKSTEQVPRPVSSRDFPNFNADQAAQMRLLSAPQLASWLEEIFEIDIRPAQQPRQGGAMLIVDLRCPGGRLSLGFSVELMPALSLAVQADAHAEVSFATLVAARLLRPFLDQFGHAAKRAGDRRWHALGVASIRCLAAESQDFDVGRLPAPLAAWDVTLANHISTTIVLISLDPACVTALQDMVDSRPSLQHAGMHNWNIQTTLRIATRSWPTILVKTLEVGDVLLIGNASSTGTLNARLFCGSTAGRHWTCSAHVKGEKITMTSEFETHDGRSDADEVAASIPLPNNIAELEVPVHFEVDSAALSLAQLATLRSGYVINLSLPVEEAEIRLIACGQLVGRGRLVVIGDCLGVQIDHIASGRA